MVDVKALAAKQRAELEATVPEVAPVMLGGELLDVSFSKIRGDEWEALVVSHAPRPGTTDARIGFNASTLPGAFPVEHVLIDGESIDAETWLDMWGALDFPERTTIANTLYGMHVFKPLQARIALGKAKAGAESDSPANSESHHADSKAGSPQS